MKQTATKPEMAIHAAVMRLPIAVAVAGSIALYGMFGFFVLSGVIFFVL